MMTTAGVQLDRFVADLRIGLLFCTRLPLIHSAPIAGGDVARASWAFPIAGALIGLLGGLAYWIALRVGLPPILAAAIALTATLLATGCLHEDGLADTADGFGGGNSREHRLAIMRDSRLGTFGGCALVMSVGLRWGALASIAEATEVATALVAAHASARATLPAFMALLPPARAEGLSADAGRPPRQSIVAALLLGVVATGLALGPVGAAIGIVLLVSATVLLAWLSLKLIGGQTGDVVGALEQINEILILLTAAVLLNAATQR